MGCFTDNIYNLNYLNNCKTSIQGIKRLFTAVYSDDVYKYMIIQNNSLQSINKPISFLELIINQKTCKYNEKYNQSTKKYEQTFELDLSAYDPEKRLSIDSLLKVKQIFIIETLNGKYFIFGEKNGLLSYENDFNLQDSGYNIKFKTSNDYAAIEVSKNFIDNFSGNCDDLNDQNTGSIYFWQTYRDCIIY